MRLHGNYSRSRLQAPRITRYISPRYLRDLSPRLVEGIINSSVIADTQQRRATIAQAVRSPALGIWDSTLNTNDMELAALGGTPRGAILVWSPGEDAVFMSAEDGPGTVTNSVLSLFSSTNFNPKVVEEYDDVLVFGGS